MNKKWTWGECASTSAVLASQLRHDHEALACIDHPLASSANEAFERLAA